MIKTLLIIATKLNNSFVYVSGICLVTLIIIAFIMIRTDGVELNVGAKVSSKTTKSATAYSFVLKKTGEKLITPLSRPTSITLDKLPLTALDTKHKHAVPLFDSAKINKPKEPKHKSGFIYVTKKTDATKVSSPASNKAAKAVKKPTVASQQQPRFTYLQRITQAPKGPSSILDNLSVSTNHPSEVMVNFNFDHYVKKFLEPNKPSLFQTGLLLKNTGQKLITALSRPTSITRDKLPLTALDTKHKHAVPLSDSAKINKPKEPKHKSGFIYVTKKTETTKVSSPALNKASKAVKKPRETLVSFNFQGIAVKDLLRVIATGRGIDFILSPSITGNMNLKMTNVAWKEALQTVLSLNNLDYIKYGKLLWIGPSEEVSKRKSLLQGELAQSEEDKAVEKPMAKMFHLKYADAASLMSAISKQAETILSDPGSMEIDERTNSIWVYNTEENIDKIATFIDLFDKPAKQVLIRARMITLDSTYGREIGLRFGITRPTPLVGNMGSAVAASLTASHTLGKANTNLTVSEQLTSVAGLELQGSGTTNGRLNFDLPATTLFANPASIGVALIKVGSFFLDFEISAMVSEGHAEMIANPSIITANNKTAHIEHGKQVPYPASSASGETSVTFQNASLSLDVTPKIMHDNIVDLQIKVANNSLGAVVSGSNSPAINTQNVTSQVFLRHGETVVLGGIYTKTATTTVNRVPYLSDIPIIGRLFQKKHWHEARKEMIIFITPEIIESTAKSVSYAKESVRVISDFMEPFKYIQKEQFITDKQKKEFKNLQEIEIKE